MNPRQIYDTSSQLLGHGVQDDRVKIQELLRLDAGEAEVN
jgi:hypothetical protein